MKNAWIPALAFATAIAAAGQSVTYRMQPSAENRFTLVVTKTGFLSGKQHLLEFGKYQGEAQFDKDNPSRSQVQLEVQAGDIVVKDTWVSEKDRKKIHEHAVTEMLQSQQHPVIRFVSTSVEPAGDEMKVSGNLTIRGVTRPVDVFVKVKESGGGTLLVEGRSQFRMTAFGLKPPSAALGTVGTKDQMDLSFLLRSAAVN